MKKIFVTLCIALISIGTNAQIKSTSLYDLLTVAIPDSTATDTVYNWNKGISIYPLVKWRTKPTQLDLRDKNGKLLDQFTKQGSISLKLNNMKAEEDELDLSGTSKGYSEIRLSTSLPQDFTLQKLIGNKQTNIVLLKKDEDIEAYKYSLKLPGKKQVWLNIFSIDAVGDGNKTLEIVCYLKYGDLPSD